MQKLKPEPKVGQIWRVLETDKWTTLRLDKLLPEREDGTPRFSLSLGRWSDEEGFVREDDGNDAYILIRHPNTEYEFISETGDPPVIWKGLCAECDRPSMEDHYLCEHCLTIL